MAKASEPKKPVAKTAAKPAPAKAAPAKAAAPAKKATAKDKGGETPVSSKEVPAPAKSKTGNTDATRAKPDVKGAAAPSTKAGAKKGDHTEATGRDHPSQSEHAKALFQKLHGASAQRNAGGPPGGGKKGFDPRQVSGGKGNMGGAHNQMMRRTQSRGGGGGGGGGGGQV